MKTTITLPTPDMMRLFWLSRFEAQKLSKASDSALKVGANHAAQVAAQMASEFEALSNQIWLSMSGGKTNAVN